MNSFARAQAPAPVVESLEHELKFALAPTAVPALRAWLRGAVRPDPEFAHGIVSSIYYDTRDWRLLYEKVNSDYLKTKVRVRWYSPPDSPEQGGRAFLEAKYRIGNRREKVRIPLPETGPELMARGLDDAMLVELPKRLRARGLAVDPTLVPTILIRYERERWVDLAGHARVSLDTNISCPAASPGVFAPVVPGALRIAIVEAKGHFAEIPATLYTITSLGGRRTSFSRYWACYQHSRRLAV